MKKSLFPLLFPLSFIITSCNVDDGSSSVIKRNKRYDIALTRSQQEIANENVKFAFSLFDKVNELETGQSNWIVSPLSASIALSMTANGTAGNSQTQIKDALGFSRFQMDEVNSYYNYLCNELIAVDNSTKFNIANSVWLDNDFRYYDSFVKTNQEMYDAEVATLDLSNESSLKKINDWSAKKTENLIPVIINELADGMDCCLLNSLYFRAEWDAWFNESLTVDEMFTSSNGKQSQVKMMKKQNINLYYSNETFALTEFPFGNSAFSMVVLLPHENCTLEESLQKFTVDYWSEYQENKMGKLADLVISFPRFEIEYEKDLSEIMKCLGISDVFDIEKADFSNMTPDHILVSLVKQAARIKVDEKGCEAAVTTMVEEMYGSPSVPKADFHMNRPFAFLIKEESTGTILFMGKVTEL